MASAGPVQVREIRKRRTKSSPSSAIPTKIMKADVVQEQAVSEEEECLLRNSDEDLKLFSETLMSIRKYMKDILELKISGDKSAAQKIAENKLKVSMLFMVLKKLNRLDKFRCQKATDNIQETMLKVDNIHLQLQNLHYEAVHLQKEITKCLEFKSLHENINLVPVETFINEAPAKLIEISKKDNHQLMLQRLQWELEQRQELAKKLAESERKLGKVSSERTKLQSYIENLKPTLKSILKAADPLQNELGIPLLALNSFHEMAKFLPQPLFIMFVQSSAYMEACDKSLNITVDGDAEEAANWKEADEDLDDDSDSDQEENGKRKRRRQSTVIKMENRRKKLLQKHPLSVKIRMNCSDHKEITLNFYYIAALHIVTVDILISSPVDNTAKSGNLLSTTTLLDSLFPSDDGNDTPNHANYFQLEKLGMSKFSDYVSKIGKPYLWVQRISGLSFSNKSANNNLLQDQKSHQNAHMLCASNIEETFQAIKTRFLTRVALLKHFLLLEKGIIPVSKECSNLFCGKIMSSLTSWKDAEWSMIPYKLKEEVSNLCEEEVLSMSNSLYCATIERGSAKLYAYAFLSSAYPKCVPFFFLTVDWQGSHTSLDNSDIRDMEKEVNIFYDEFNTDRPENILVNQLERLRMCFDIYLETAAARVSNVSEGPCEFPKEKFFIQSVRGKDHCRPFKFLPSTGMFTHR